MKGMTGATHVFPSFHGRRKTRGALSDPLTRLNPTGFGALTSVHNDFCDNYGPALIKSFVTGEQYTQRFGFTHEFSKDPSVTEELLRSSRMVVINTWRSVTPYPVECMPLAVADRRSIAREHLRCNKAGAPKGGLDLFGIVHTPSHAWYYFPKMHIDEVLLFKTYDSEEEPFLPTMHSAFADPDSPEDPRERHSVEVRVLCLIPMEGKTSRLSTCDYD